MLVWGAGPRLLQSPHCSHPPGPGHGLLPPACFPGDVAQPVAALLVPVLHEDTTAMLGKLVAV